MTLIQGFTKTKEYVVQTYHLKSHPEGKRKNNNTFIPHCTIKFEAGAKEQNITRTSIIEIYPHSLNDPFSLPTRTGKPGKMGKHFPVTEKLGNFVSPEKWEP